MKGAVDQSDCSKYAPLFESINKENHESKPGASKKIKPSVRRRLSIRFKRKASVQNVFKTLACDKTVDETWPRQLRGKYNHALFCDG